MAETTLGLGFDLGFSLGLGLLGLGLIGLKLGLRLGLRVGLRLGLECSAYNATDRTKLRYNTMRLDELPSVVVAIKDFTLHTEHR